VFGRIRDKIREYVMNVATLVTGSSTRASLLRDQGRFVSSFVTCAGGLAKLLADHHIKATRVPENTACHNTLLSNHLRH
jgi:hypothetical protein